MPRHDLGAVASGRVGMAQAVERFAPGGFDVLAGRSGSGTLASLDRARIDPLLSRLRTHGDEDVVMVRMTG